MRTFVRFFIAENFDFEASRHLLCLNALSLSDDTSSDEDDEITWTCLQRSQKRPHESYSAKHGTKATSKTPERKDSEEPKSPTSGKPPRPSYPAASLDRRQRSRSQSNRRERDSKSRSTHSLRDKDDKILISDKLAKENSSSSVIEECRRSRGKRRRPHLSRHGTVTITSIT